MAQQYIPQGVLNRLRTSVTIPAYPLLNVTPPFLGKRSVRLTRNGRAVENLQSLTSIVPSPEPYVMIELHINLLKSQSLADDWEQQYQSMAQIGQVTVRTDTSTLRQFIINTTSIITVDELSFAGDSPDYMVTCEGQLPINSLLWNS